MGIVQSGRELLRSSERNTMSEQTNTLLQNAGEEVLSWLQTTGDLVHEEAPKLAHDIIAYGVVKGSFEVGLGITFLVLSCLLVFKFIPLFVRKSNEGVKNEDSWIAASFGGGLAGILFTIMGLVNTYHGGLLLLKALFAPRYLVVQTILRLL